MIKIVAKYEKDILPFIQDFDTFIKFILEKEPDLSKKHLVLGKNDCFELNSQLNFKKQTEKATYNQNQYLIIDLNFILATTSELVLIKINNKNKFKLVKTPKLDEFMSLNICEKYVFLLEHFWTKYDFEESLRYDMIGFFELIYIISKVNVDTKILKENLKSGRNLFSSNAMFSNILRVLGLVQLEFIDTAKSKYDDSIKSVSPTAFGIEICKVLSTKALEYFNFEYIDMIKDIFKIKNDRKEISFFNAISEVFEEGVVEKTINYDLKVNRKGTYIFKVSLSNSVWRIVKLSHKNTFHHLHKIIQKAFEFDDDHMYGFYNGVSYRSGKEFYSGSPMGVSDEYEELTIEEANFYKGKQFIYLFDFGDSWEFKITIIDFIENEENDFLPEILDSKGEAPQQYPDWE